jgi:hypothetical protein
MAYTYEFVTKEDKLRMIADHTRNLEFQMYGNEITLLELTASNADAASIAKMSDLSNKIKDQIASLNAQKALVEAE